MTPEWYENTFIVIPLLGIGAAITAVIGTVIAGITLARYVVRRWDD